MFLRHATFSTVVPYDSVVTVACIRGVIPPKCGNSHLFKVFYVTEQFWSRFDAGGCSGTREVVLAMNTLLYANFYKSTSGEKVMEKKRVEDENPKM